MEIMKTLEELRQEAIETLENDDKLFCNMVEELDSYSGYGDGFRCYPMCELNEHYCNSSAEDIIRDLTKDFCVDDNYFYYTIYGLESCDDKTELYRDNTTITEVLDAILNDYPHLWFSDSDFKELIENIDDYDSYCEQFEEDEETEQGEEDEE